MGLERILAKNEKLLKLAINNCVLEHSAFIAFAKFEVLQTVVLGTDEGPVMLQTFLQKSLDTKKSTGSEKNH